MLGELVAAVLERALAAELAAHLGYDRHETSGRGSGNSRNGYIAKTVQTGIGPVPLAVPRDRAGSFEPLLLPKRAGRVADGRRPASTTVPVPGSRPARTGPAPPNRPAGGPSPPARASPAGSRAWTTAHPGRARRPAAWTR